MGLLILIAIFFGIGAALSFGWFVIQLIFWGLIILAGLALLVELFDS